MDKAHVAAEYEALFGVRRAALALVCLGAEGPMRWTDVRHALSRLTGEQITDKAATRALHALQRLGLVEVVDGADGNHLYALTPRGTDRSHQVGDLFTRLSDHKPEPTG